MRVRRLDAIGHQQPIDVDEQGSERSQEAAWRESGGPIEPGAALHRGEGEVGAAGIYRIYSAIGTAAAIVSADIALLI